MLYVFRLQVDKNSAPFFVKILILIVDYLILLFKSVIDQSDWVAII